MLPDAASYRQGESCTMVKLQALAKVVTPTASLCSAGADLRLQITLMPRLTCKLIHSLQELSQPRALDDKHSPWIELLTSAHHVGHHAWGQPGGSARCEAADEGAVQIQDHGHAPLELASLCITGGLSSLHSQGSASFGDAKEMVCHGTWPQAVLTGM